MLTIRRIRIDGNPPNHWRALDGLAESIRLALLEHGYAVTVLRERQKRLLLVPIRWRKSENDRWRPLTKDQRLAVIMLVIAVLESANVSCSLVRGYRVIYSHPKTA